MGSGVYGCEDIEFRDIDLAHKCHVHRIGATGYRLRLPQHFNHVEGDFSTTGEYFRVGYCRSYIVGHGEWIACQAWRRLDGNPAWNEEPPTRGETFPHW